MNINFLHNLFTWIAIIAAGLSFLSMVGSYYTGKIIDKRQNENIQKMEANIDVVKPRAISGEQRKLLKEKLEHIKGVSVVLVCRMMDGESADFAKQIEEVFNESGWSVGPMNSTFLDDNQGFLTAAISSDVDPKIIPNIKEIFEYAGLNFQYTEIRPKSLTIEQQPKTLYIIVGRK